MSKSTGAKKTRRKAFQVPDVPVVPVDEEVLLLELEAAATTAATTAATPMATPVLIVPLAVLLG